MSLTGKSYVHLLVSHVRWDLKVVIWCLAFSNLFTCFNFLPFSDLMFSFFQIFLLVSPFLALSSFPGQPGHNRCHPVWRENMNGYKKSEECDCDIRRPSICFHPGVQAVNEWQLDRKTDTDRPDSGASRPLAERQHQLFGVYHQSINQGGALSIFDMSTRVSHFGVIFPNHSASGRDLCASH